MSVETVETPEVSEGLSTQPIVSIDGTSYDYMTCTSIERNSGIIPSRAIIKIAAADWDTTGPITLNAYSWPFKFGSRVKITCDDAVAFLGQLGRRNDQGMDDSIVWTAYDDMWLLQQIYLRGCLVWDSKVEQVKFIPRYTMRANPEGRWNCIPVTINGGLYPVFAAVPDIGKTYESPNETFPAAMEEGKLTAWTPRRLLMYGQLLCSLKAGDVPGILADEWRSLADSTRLLWSIESTNIQGADPAIQGNDPLDRKFPDCTFQGMRMNLFLEQVLKVAGTHELSLVYGSDASEVHFHPAVVFNQPTEQNQSVIPCLRSGRPTSANTAFDFTLDEDATQISESVLVEGQPVRVESMVTTDPVSPQVYQTFFAAWTDAEEAAFKACITGNPAATPPYYAWFPKTQNDTTEGNRLYADGKDGSGSGSGTNGLVPYALAGSQAAVALARQCFPRVYRAYSIDSANLYSEGTLKGINQAYKNAPYLSNVPRPILETQLQYYVQAMKDGAEAEARLLERMPIRIQVKNELMSPNVWQDVPFDVGVRVTGDGLIWLDGLAEAADSRGYCSYIGSLTSDPSHVTRRQIRMNVAFPLDVRVKGTAVVPGGESSLSADMAKELGGPPLLYVDSLGAYEESHQVNSSPSASTKWYTGSGTVTTPINRLLPPGSEALHATYAAERRLAGCRYPIRTSSWKLVGIRLEYTVGTWIDRVQMIGGASGENDYNISAPIRSVIYDFVGQLTIIGGLLSNLTANQNKSTRSLFGATSTLPQNYKSQAPRYFSDVGKTVNNDNVNFDNTTVRETGGAKGGAGFDVKFGGTPFGWQRVMNGMGAF